MLAPDMGAGEAQIVPQKISQKFARLDRAVILPPVDGNCDLVSGHLISIIKSFRRLRKISAVAPTQIQHLSIQILTTRITKNNLKKVNHKEHKGHIGREARKIEFLRPLRLNHPKGDGYSRPIICDLCALCG
jgi:hypothetical protein